jgi:broad specificity phosphatase PhoE
MSARALAAIDRVLDGAEDADDVVRGTVHVLAEEPGIVWAGIALAEGEELVLGPRAGEPDESQRRSTPISYQGERVGELWVDGEADQAFLDRVARAIAAHVLLAWDTGGEAWEP